MDASAQPPTKECPWHKECPGHAFPTVRMENMGVSYVICPEPCHAYNIIAKDVKGHQCRNCRKFLHYQQLLDGRLLTDLK